MRAAAARRALGLRPPARRTGLLGDGLAAAAVALLALAAAQPALTHTSGHRLRTDVQAVFVVDTSRSMAASASPRSTTRLDRARAAAAQFRAAIPNVAAGIATLTDRVLPDLLPVLDAGGFDAVLTRAVAIDSPPPRETSVRATSYSALTMIPLGNYFERGVARKIIVLLTDGESRPIDSGEIASALSQKRGYRLIMVRFWRSDESIFGSNGTAGSAYRPDPSGRAILEALATAAGGRAFEEDQVGDAARDLRRLVGNGPIRPAQGSGRTLEPLAPFAAAAAIVLFAASLWRADASLTPRLAGTGRRSHSGDSS